MSHFIWIVPILVVLATLVVMQWFGKLPSVTSISALATVMNTRGGNILLLSSLSIAFFVSGIRLIYWSTMLTMQGKIDMKEAVLILPGFGWITGTAFGGAFGALLKTMTGEDQAPPPQETKPTGQ